MRKTIFNALLFAMAMIGFSACSNDDDVDAQQVINEQNEAIEALTKTYLEDVVYPTYTNLANACDELNTLITSLNTKLQNGTQVTDSEIQAICNKYLEARKHWELSESFLYGAASDYNIDPHIDTWPLAVETLKDILVDEDCLANLQKDGYIEYARKTLAEDGQLGFHGIEFIFFRDGKPRSASVFNNDQKEQYKDFFSGVNVGAKAEVVYAKAVAGDLRDKTFQLEVCWNPNASSAHKQRVTACQSSMGEDYGITIKGGNVTYGEDMLATGTTGKRANSWKKLIEVILVDGCSGICAEVADQKMGQAYRCATGNGGQHEEDGEMVDDDPNYIESPYSYNSFTDFYDNILAIQNALYGNICESKLADASVMGYLRKYNPTMEAELQSKLTNAINKLDACKKSGKAFVQAPGATYVKDAIEAVGELDDAINEANNWILKN